MTRHYPSFHFSHAVLRTPSKNIDQGLRAVDVGAPDYEKFLQQHENYATALTDAGVKVDILPALENFPDAVFIEDDALCLPNMVIQLRPGAESRQDEAKILFPDIAPRFKACHSVAEPGRVEGGDILVTEQEIIIGLSARTNQEGAEAVHMATRTINRPVRIVETPPGVLHFKTDCALLDENCILATKRLAVSGCFAQYTTLIVPDDEQAAANSIRVNDHVIMPSGYPETKKMLKAAGYNLITVDISEAAKLDGGLSCMSLRFG